MPVVLSAKTVKSVGGTNMINMMNGTTVIIAALMTFSLAWITADVPPSSHPSTLLNNLKGIVQ